MLLKPFHFDKDSIPIKGKSTDIQPEEILSDKDRTTFRSNPKDLNTGTLRLSENQVKRKEKSSFSFSNRKFFRCLDRQIHSK